MKTEFKMKMKSNSQNESFARVTVSAFITAHLNPTLQIINDIKTAVSEAVTNSIIHGYDENEHGKITIKCLIIDNQVIIEVRDRGKGIDDIKQAMTPLYTSKPDAERSGIGFTVMETFMDSVTVESEKNIGTTVTMKKTVS